MATKTENQLFLDLLKTKDTEKGYFFPKLEMSIYSKNHNGSEKDTCGETFKDPHECSPSFP